MRRSLLLVTAGNLLPLLLVALGALDLPLLLVCYGLEIALLPRHPDDSWTDDLKLRLVTTVVALILLARALQAVDWSPGTLLVLAATVVLTLLGQWTAARDPHALTVRGGLGAALWRLCLLLVGGVVALSYAEDLAELRERGWTPAPVGDFVATYPAWWFNEVVVALGLAPLSAAAVVLVVFKTVNEGLWTAIRGLTDSPPRETLDTPPGAPRRSAA